jgi:hypothetical protein
METIMKQEKDRQIQLIKMAEANGIYVPPRTRTYNSSAASWRNGGFSRVIGAGCWFTSRKRRAEIAERGLKAKGLI